MTTLAPERRHGDGPAAISRVSAWGPDEVRWVDLDATDPRAAADPANLARLVDQLNEHCGGQVDAEMARDLLEVERDRRGTTYRDGIRSVSSFTVEAEHGQLVFQPVEILAGPGWLVSAWHPRRAYRGADRTGREEPPLRPADLLEDMEGRWERERARSAGDLGVMLLHELGLGYRLAAFEIRRWLEEWELRLYREAQPDKDGLERLWSSMAVLRDWIQPLNRPGITSHEEKSWFADVTDHRLVVECDDRCIDRALDEVRSLADVMRATFNVLSVRMLEEQRERREQLQERLEIGAAIFLVPTLVVGFYGANTHLPGEQTWWGFWVMVSLLVVLSAASVWAVLTWQRRRRDRRS